MTTDMQAPTEAQIEAIITKACGKYRIGDSYSFEDVWNCIEAALACCPDARADEPIAYEFQHDETGRTTFVDPWQVEQGFATNNPRWQLIGPVFRHARAAAPQAEAAQGVPVAWQVRRADGRIDGVPIQWESCTKELFEATLATGRYAGYENGPRCEVRALCVAAAPSPDREQVGEPIPGSPAFALRGLYKLATEYFIDGKPATPDEYIAWQRGIIEALTSAKIPDPKYYGTQVEDGDQHEVKCAYVDGWNQCRASILAKDASPSRECGEQWPSDRDAAIQACALMILGICKTRPQEVWPKEIEGRIRYMLSKIAPAVEQPGLTDEQRSVIQHAADMAHRVLCAGGDYGDELSDPGLRSDLKAARDQLRALLSKGGE